MRNMINNLKVRTRLLAVFLFTVLVAFALIIFSIRESRMVQENYMSILSGPVAVTNSVQRSEKEVNSIARLLRDMALSGYSPSLMDEIQDSVASIDEALTTIQTAYTNTDGLATAYIQSVQDWEGAFEDIYTALQDNDLEEARRLIDTQCTPKLNQAISDGNALVSQVHSELSSTVTSTGKDTARSQLVLFLVAIAVILVGVFLNLRAIHNIVAPLKEAEEAVVAFSHGDLSVEVNYTSAN